MVLSILLFSFSPCKSFFIISILEVYTVFGFQIEPKIGGPFATDTRSHQLPHDRGIWHENREGARLLLNSLLRINKS